MTGYGFESTPGAEAANLPLRRLAIFFRNPAEGKVKTRLARHLGDEEVLAAYRAMAQDLLANLEPVRGMVVAFFDDLPEEGSEGLTWGAGIRRQCDGDLGARMAGAFAELFAEGVEDALLIGSDIPQIDGFLIAGYFQALASHDLVIGPAADGGYYLIGFHRDTFAPELFEGIEWSTDRVYRQTLAAARKLGLAVYTGKTLRDIDTYEDLESLIHDRHAEVHLHELVRLFLQRKGA